MAALIDTNLLLALVFPDDIHHQAALAAMRDSKIKRIIPAPVLPEFFYMAATRMDYDAAIRAFQLTRSNMFYIENLTADDMTRMDAIMVDYADNQFDFVDVALMAIAERLDICEIYTFDHRDFMVYRPPHCDFFELLP
ncbi:MAG: PIN domain-containing protein [Chloroflexota bacterium]